VAGLEVGAVVNDSPVDCQSRERPSRAARGANQVLLPAPDRNNTNPEQSRFVFFFTRDYFGIQISR